MVGKLVAKHVPATYVAASMATVAPPMTTAPPLRDAEASVPGAVEEAQEEVVVKVRPMCVRHFICIIRSNMDGTWVQLVLIALHGMLANLYHGVINMVGRLFVVRWGLVAKLLAANA